MIDHEGGKVWRFNSKEFPNPGPMKQLGELYNKDPKAALEHAYNLGKMIATDLLACNINLNLAPILDLDHNSISSVIGDRALHSDPNIVAIISYKFIQGQAAVGMKAVGKHFPGHGAIKTDTHLEVSIDPRSTEEIFNTDLVPFLKLIQGDPILGIPPESLPGLMPAHIIYPAVDQINPTGFSEKWLKDILRNQLGFKGVIISDCLSMQAAQKFHDNSKEIIKHLFELTNIIGSTSQMKNLALTRQALLAGCDLVIFNGLHEQELEHLLYNLDFIDPLLNAEKSKRARRIFKLLP